MLRPFSPVHGDTGDVYIMMDIRKLGTAVVLQYGNQKIPVCWFHLSEIPYMHTEWKDISSFDIYTIQDE